VSILPILAIGCESDPPTDAGVNLGAKSAAVLSANGCFDPAQHGGAPDDDLDDRAAIQAAIDDASIRGGRVCLGEGRWRVSRAPLSSYNRAAALTIHASKVGLSGNGPGTVIEVVGDQAAATLFVVGIDPPARNVTLRDFGIDTSGTFNTGEQTHAIHVGSGLVTGPVEDVRIERIIFNHPRNTDARKGDCLRLVGEPAPNQVRRVIVIGSTFTSCARSGISIQRGVHDLTINGNQFTQTSDQDIDSEPTAPGGNSGLTIVGNTFRDDVALTAGDWSVTLGGYDGPMSGVTLSNNVFEGRGAYLYHTANLVISGNTFNAMMESGYAILHFGGRTENIAVSGNSLRRQGIDGPMINIVHASGSSAKNVTISNNEMVQETLGSGIVAESAVKTSVINNGIEWTQPAPSAFGIHLRSTTVAADAIMVSGNRLVGSIRYGVLLGAGPNAFNTTSVVGNLTTGATASLRCDQSVAGNFNQPIVVSGNNFNSPPQCGIAALVASRP
jgi:hypothetical protein